MTTYKHLGYFNGIDAVYLAKQHPKTSIEWVLNDMGSFHHCNDDEDYTLEELTKKHSNENTFLLGEHIVVKDVKLSYYDTEIDEADEEDMVYEFVDIYIKS